MFDPILQIADFGLSNLYHQGKFLQTFCGSPLYASPEIVNGKPYTGPEVSVWTPPPACLSLDPGRGMRYFSSYSLSQITKLTSPPK